LSVTDAISSFLDLPLRWKILAVAAAMVLVEIAFRRIAPRSRAYARWTAFFEGLGKVWTAVLLAIVYLFSVGPVGLVMRLLRHDPLDRRLAPEPSYWRPHEPNPLGPERAARHQF
jgi:hypothetical protein